MRRSGRFLLATPRAGNGDLAGDRLTKEESGRPRPRDSRPSCNRLEEPRNRPLSPRGDAEGTRVPSLTRWSHASWLLAGGADFKSVMERMGHAQIQTTQKYLRTLSDTDRRGLEALTRTSTGGPERPRDRASAILSPPRHPLGTNRTSGFKNGYPLGPGLAPIGQIYVVRQVVLRSRQLALMSSLNVWSNRPCEVAMNSSLTTTATSSAVRAILLKLAKSQDDLAAQAAAAVPYWTPCPPTILGHRAAARPREQADEFLAESIGRSS